MKILLLLVLLLLLLPDLSVATQDDLDPIHVFILAGQSNMVGMGSLEHLDELVHESNCSCMNEYRRNLWNSSNHSYVIRNDVYIKYGNSVGPLTINHNFAAQHCFGPELMFGVELGNYFYKKTESVTTFLIKTAFGGRTLGVDFRPPLSGEGNYSNIVPSHYGWEYREMVTEIQDALENIGTYVPDSNGRNVSIDGFVWFQGWNDMLSWPFVNEYEYNLANLMRDVQRETQVQNLPFIIGELGMHGLNYTGRGADRVQKMRESEYNVTTYDEFQSTSLFVRTAPFVVSNGTTYNGDYHYYGRADTYFHIGQAFGKGMIELLEAKRKRKVDKVSSSKLRGGDDNRERNDKWSIW